MHVHRLTKKERDRRDLEKEDQTEHQTVRAHASTTHPFLLHQIGNRTKSGNPSHAPTTSLSSLYPWNSCYSTRLHFVARSLNSRNGTHTLKPHLFSCFMSNPGAEGDTYNKSWNDNMEHLLFERKHFLSLNLFLSHTAYSHHYLHFKTLNAFRSFTLKVPSLFDSIEWTSSAIASSRPGLQQDTLLPLRKIPPSIPRRSRSAPAFTALHVPRNSRASPSPRAPMLCRDGRLLDGPRPTADENQPSYEITAVNGWSTSIDGGRPWSSSSRPPSVFLLGVF